MKDYGCDPVGDGMFKMVPSGDIVNKEERDKRLREGLAGAGLLRKAFLDRPIFGMTWDELEKKQGGKLSR